MPGRPGRAFGGAEYHRQQQDNSPIGQSLVRDVEPVNLGYIDLWFVAILD
jgi:hypothetical protein